MGRFLSEDPLPLMHRYTYVSNSPANYVDPSGLCHADLGYDQVCRQVHDKEGGGGGGCQANVVGDIGVGVTGYGGFALGGTASVRGAASFDSCGDVALVGTAGAGGGAIYGGGLNFISGSILFGGSNGDRAGGGATAGGCFWAGFGGCIAFTGSKGIGGVQIDLGVGGGFAFFGTGDYTGVFKPWNWRP